MVAIRLPAEIESRLDASAAATERTKSFYVRQAIMEQIDDLEDLYVAEQRLTDIRAGRTTEIPIEDVMKKHGVAD